MHILLRSILNVYYLVVDRLIPMDLMFKCTFGELKSPIEKLASYGVNSALFCGSPRWLVPVLRTSLSIHCPTGIRNGVSPYCVGVCIGLSLCFCRGPQWFIPMLDVHVDLKSACH